jgi:hypothetical protein
MFFFLFNIYISLFIADIITKLQKELSKYLHWRGIRINLLLFADGRFQLTVQQKILR